jgi:hypothetical protein
LLLLLLPLLPLLPLLVLLLVLDPGWGLDWDWATLMPFPNFLDAQFHDLFRSNLA